MSILSGDIRIYNAGKFLLPQVLSTLGVLRGPHLGRSPSRVMSQTVRWLFRVIDLQSEINIVILINYEIQKLLHRVLCFGCHPFGDHARLRICTSGSTSM